MQQERLGQEAPGAPDSLRCPRFVGAATVEQVQVQPGGQPARLQGAGTETAGQTSAGRSAFNLNGVCAGQHTGRTDEAAAEQRNLGYSFVKRLDVESAPSNRNSATVRKLIRSSQTKRAVVDGREYRYIT